MIFKQLIDFLNNTELDEAQELCVVSGEQLDKVVDIYIDERGSLVFYTGEQYEYLKSCYTKDLKKIINKLQFDYNSKLYIDCNEYVLISNIYICKDSKKLIFALICE